MKEPLPLSNLVEMLSSKTVPIDKRIELAEEQIECYKEMVERLERTLTILRERKTS